ncbi:MAG: hypothetical protein IJ418_12810 [Clostridia bacterium]|nr:hypothetical protein [Clostridia bacterium]
MTTFAFGFGASIILHPPLAADDLRVPQRGRLILSTISGFHFGEAVAAQP